MAEDVYVSQSVLCIITDFINRGIGSEGYECDESFQTQCDRQAEIGRRLSQLGDEIAEISDLSYKSMREKFQNTTDNLFSTFVSFAKNVFDYGIKWKRVDVLFQFGSSIAVKATSDSFLSQVKNIIGICFMPWFFQKGRWIQEAMLLLLSLLLNTSSGARTRLKHGIGTTAKVTKLILWVCGDVETNPGPGNSRSEILRKFRKSQQRSILILLYKEFESSSIPKSLYKEAPKWWPSDTPFVNITNQKKDDESILCFEKSIELLKNSSSGLSQDWTNILEFYNDLLNKCGDNGHLNMCKDKLLEWMGCKKIQKALQTVDKKSFMDDLRIKLKVLEDLAKIGEKIPDDIADKISAVNMTITGSKWKRKFGISETVDKSHSPKRKKSESMDGTLHAAHEDTPVADQMAHEETKPSENSHIDHVDIDSLSIRNIDFNNDSVESQGLNGNSTHLPEIKTLKRKAAQNNCVTNSVEDKTPREKNESLSDEATSSSLELPSDLLNIILNENVENDIIESFDLDLLELSNKELISFMK